LSIFYQLLCLKDTESLIQFRKQEIKIICLSYGQSIEQVLD